MKAKISFITLQIMSALSGLLFLALGIVAACQKVTDVLANSPIYYQQGSSVASTLMQGCPHWLSSLAIFLTIGFLSFAILQLCAYKIKKGACKSAEHQIS